jgi:hypothetical protein
MANDFQQGCKGISMEKKSVQSVELTQKNGYKPLPYMIQKVSSKLMLDLNVRAKTIKLLRAHKSKSS